MSMQDFDPTLKTLYLWDGSKGVPNRTIKFRVLAETCSFPERLPRNDYGEVTGAGVLGFDVIRIDNADTHKEMRQLTELLFASYEWATSWADTPYSSWNANTVQLGVSVPRLERAMLNVVLVVQDPTDASNTHYRVYKQAGVAACVPVGFKGAITLITVSMHFYTDPVQTLTAPWM